MQKILITGGNGFLGSVLAEKLIYSCQTLGRGKANDFVYDLSKGVPPINERFTHIIHCAGKAHIVPKTETEKQSFFDINVDGTRNLIKGVTENIDAIKQFIFISTVAVYGLESGENIHENCPLKGSTPYALSKIQAERLLIEWAERHEIPLVILRLPLIVGTNPPGNLRFIANAISKGLYVRIKGNYAQKSMVLAEDVAQLISELPINTSGIYNLTDGTNPTFAQVEDAIAISYQKRIPLSIPLSLINIVARIGDGLRTIGIPFPIFSERIEKMTSSLTFSDLKARKEIDWSPRPVLPFIENHKLV